MNRATFLNLLTRAVKDGNLTEGQASDLLRQYDRGELGVDEGGVPSDEPIQPLTDVEVESAIASLLALGTLAYLHLRRSHFREVLQDRFIEKAKGLAKARVAGKALREWQSEMSAEIRSHVVQQAAVGSGRVPTANALTEAVTLQDAYLARWADEHAVGSLLGEPPSELGMMARAALYAGAGRAEGYRAEAELYPEGGAVTYEAVDDSGTCQACLDAEGTYSVSGPFPTPGAVCEGYGNCRCTLEFSEAAA